MTRKVYSIRDSKSEVFLTPFLDLTHGAAERNFHQLVNDEKSRINIYPDDFDLYYLGEFDDVKGTYYPLQNPELLVKGILLFEKAKRMNPERSALDAGPKLN